MELHVFSCGRMDKTERAGMKQLAAHFYSLYFVGLLSWSVELIADERVVDICHMHPYLVGPSGLKLCPDECVLPESLKHFYMRYGIFRRGAVYGVTHAVSLIASYRFIDSQFVFPDVVIYESGVLSCDAVLFELRGKRLVRFIVFGYHEKSAGVLVYPVDYARADDSVNRRKGVSHVIHYRVDQSS